MKTPIMAARVVLALGACAGLLAGCASTTTGNPVTSKPQGPDAGAVVSLLDTGTYETAASRPFGAAGDDLDARNLLEAHRMATFVVGPWEIDSEIKDMPGAISLSMIGPIASPKMMADNEVFTADLVDIAAKHNFMSGFSTVRVSPEKSGQTRALHNVVLRFPDPTAAEAAAAEMATAESIRPDSPPREPITLAINPEARAMRFVPQPGVEKALAFSAHGPYVLHQAAQTTDAMLGATPTLLIDGMLDRQKSRIDEFAPTDAAAMKDLPLDPSGQLLAHTLSAPDSRAPFIMGVWNARAWLHFEEDPLLSSSLFNTAGVDIVGQRLATVYQAANADGATRLATGLTDQIAGFSSVKTIDGVPGLPSATCFQRVQGGLPSTAATTWQRVVWQFKCVATADRYAYTTFSTSADDVRQQAAAQYRILSGQ